MGLVGIFPTGLYVKRSPDMACHTKHQQLYMQHYYAWIGLGSDQITSGRIGLGQKISDQIGFGSDRFCIRKCRIGSDFKNRPIIGLYVPNPIRYIPLLLNNNSWHNCGSVCKQQNVDFKCALYKSESEGKRSEILSFQGRLIS